MQPLAQMTCHKASFMNSVDVYRLIPITYFLFYLHVRQVATNVSSYTLVCRYDQLTMNANTPIHSEGFIYFFVGFGRLILTPDTS